MDLRAITNLEGGRLQSDSVSSNDTWDPGDPTTQRQFSPPAPAPPSTPADMRTRHKDRREVMYRVPKGKRSDGAHGALLGNRTGADNDNFPHRASPDLRFHHASDPHATHAAYTSGVHATFRPAHIAAHPTFPVDPDRERGIGTSAGAPMDRRRARPEDDEHDNGVEERERYLSRPRHHSNEPDIIPKPSSPHSLLELTSCHRSSPSIVNPDSDSASSHPLTITEPPSKSSLRRYSACEFDRDQRDHTQRCDEDKSQRSPTRGERHSSEIDLTHPRSSSFPKGRSSSIESVDDSWSQNSAPPQLPPPPVQNNTTIPSVAPASASQPAPDPGTFGMLSDSELADETVHLRALLGCPPGAPVGLDALADPPPGEKPNYPLPTLIKLAIYGSPRRRLTLQEIYQALEDRFEWFRQRTDELSWKNSIRHNLSLRKCFLKVQRPITEPGKGSYWMIDLTQGEGNKRVRKRNKKPTKAQLAAQSATDAYRASARLPGQGDGPRPPPYPVLPHVPPQPQAVEDDSGDDEYQAPPMKTNFTVAPPEELHHALLRGSIAQHAQLPARRRPEELYPSTSADHASSLLPHQNSVQPLPSSYNILGLDTNIDPALRVLPKGTVPGPITASHHDIIPQRGATAPGVRPGTGQRPMPFDIPPIGTPPLARSQSVAGAPQIQQQALANWQVQGTLSHSLLVPSHTAYHHPLLSHRGTGPQTSPAVSTLHISKSSPSFIQQQLQPTPALPQLDALRQREAPRQPALTTSQPPRLPPMRTLSASPALATPSPQPASCLGAAHKRQQTSTDGFARFAAAHASNNFGKPAFGKPALPPDSVVPVRPLLLSSEDKDKGKGRAESEGKGDDHAGGDDYERRGSYSGAGSSGSRRHFAPPLPRAGIEYHQRDNGGLVTARRTAARHDEGTVDWLNRLDHEGGRGADAADAVPPKEGVS